MNSIIRVSIIVAFFLSLQASRASGQTLGDVLNPEMPSTWIGVDFSHARYSGETNNVSFEEMKEYFAEINSLILSETGKFNLNKTFHKTAIIKNTDAIKKINSGMNADNLLSHKIVEINRIEKKHVAEILKSYDTGNIQGTAIVVIIEDISKFWEQASMWVVNFDPVSKEIITASKHIGEASGIGFRNHWASAIDQVLGVIRSKEYKKWQHQFATKK